MSYRAKMALRRLAITALTVIGLWGCFTAYAQITRPLLKPVAVSLPNRPPEEPPRPGPSGELVARSERYLRRHGWLWTPRYRIRSDNAVVFAQERVSADDNDEVDDTGAVDGYRRIRFRPFAMVVFPDGRTGEPFVVTSDSAQLEFEEELSLSDVDGGRIQGATLSGAVRISGADGLRIAGRDFVYQDNGSRIWSESETSFEYDGHRGVGQGVEVTLGSAPNTGDRRLLSSTEVQRVQLRRDVRMVLRIDDEPGNDPDPVDIRSRDGVLFDLNTRIATFERDVQVFRRTGPHQADSLEHCDELMIVLAPRDAESAPHGARASGSAQGARATIRQIMARGNRLKLRSDDNELEADARSVTYDVEEHSTPSVRSWRAVRSQVRRLCWFTMNTVKSSPRNVAGLANSSTVNRVNVPQPLLQAGLARPRCGN